MRRLRRPAPLLLPLSLALLVAARPVAAQVPSTDVYLVPLEITDGTVVPGVPVNLTDREGYDNQPAFTADGRELLYSSIRDGQSDIYLRDLESGVTRRVTTAETGEYSPTPRPGLPGAISVVRDYGDGVQQLWSYPLDGGAGEVLIGDDLGAIGYHAWVDESRLVLFVLGEPPTLELATLDPSVPGSAAGRRLGANPGRALAPMPDGSGMSFVDKSQEGGWWLAVVDPGTDEVRRLFPTLPEREDYAWGPAGAAWMAEGSRLLRHAVDPGASWQEVADLGPHGVGVITRLAFHPEGRSIALVAERAPTTGE